MLALYTLKGERKHQSVIDAVPSGVAHVFVVRSRNLRACCQGRRRRALAGCPPQRSLDHGINNACGDCWVGGWLGWFMKVWMDGWLACGWCPGLSKGRFAWAVIEEFDGNKKMNIHFPPQNAMQSRPAGSRDAHSSAATHGREGGKVFLGQCWVHSVH